MNSFICLQTILFLIEDRMASMFGNYTNDPAFVPYEGGGNSFAEKERLKPIGPLIEKRGSTFILENNRTLISYTCFSSTKQVEIVSAGDFTDPWLTDIVALVDFNRNLTIVEGYKITMAYQFNQNGVKIPHVLYCKHIGSMESIRRVLIQPFNTTNEVIVTHDNEYKPEHFIHKCEYTLTILKAPGDYTKYYAKCQKSSDGTILQFDGKYTDHPCHLRPYCAFLFEKQQRKTCATVGNQQDYQQNKSLWQQIDFRRAGIKICGEFEAAAMYSYTGFDLKDRKIHFSYEYNRDIFPEDVIKISINETSFYVGDAISVNVLVIGFYITHKPVLKISSTDKVILLTNSGSYNKVEYGTVRNHTYSIKLETFGNYRIECSFIPSDSQDWMNLSKSFNVQEDRMASLVRTYTNDPVFIPLEGGSSEIEKLIKKTTLKWNPIGPLIEKRGSTFILENNRTLISYSCFSSTKQVEIVSAGDFTDAWKTDILPSVDFNGNWTIVEGYRISITYRFHENRVKSPHILYCKHVGSMKSIRRVFIQPFNTTNEVIVTHDNQYEPEHFIHKCEYTLTIVKAPGDYKKFYTKCQKSSDGTILKLQVDHTCLNRPYSAFVREKLQRKICAKVGNLQDYQQNKSSWQEIDFPKTGMKIFGEYLDNIFIKKAAAVYSYTGFDLKDRKIHFAYEYYKDIFPEDVIKISINETSFYVGDAISVNVLVIAFFTTIAPVVTITNLDKVILLSNSGGSYDEFEFGYVINGTYNMKLEAFGNYRIECSFIPSDSQVWMNLSKSFNVQEYIKPSFEADSETIEFYLGDTNKEIKCISKGNPIPDISWDTMTTSFVKINGSQLFIPKVTELLVGTYVCTAKNKDGSAQKQFKIEVYKKRYDWILPVSSCVVVIIIVIIAGIFIKYKLQKVKSELLKLTKVEMDNFFNGIQTENTYVEEEIISPEAIPYNTKYDLRRNYIKLDESSTLGTGEFGVVRKGIVEKEGKQLSVAIKSIKPGKLEYLHVLMSELKVMAYIGQHENIVSLIGAFTSNLKNRELLVCTELCEGSLHNHLNNNHQKFFDLFPDSCKKKENCVNQIVNLTTLDLLVWSKQIACGMEFLENKKIIHGDLATRNILLDKYLRAKISDFGLSKRLIGYTYIKTSACPLPWRWMAIESLSEMKFSIKSDVWAYGVTLWEIFSLGQTPYAGFSMSVDFVDELISGLRLNCPKYSNNQLYNEIIMKCWLQNPKERISFSEVKSLFTDMIENYKDIHASVKKLLTSNESFKVEVNPESLTSPCTAVQTTIPNYL